MKKIAAMLITLVCTMSVFANTTNQMVGIDLWKANVDEPSMGNIATDYNEKALYNPIENTLQIATNPVEISGYKSGVAVLKYDITGNGDYVESNVISTGEVQTGVIKDGEEYIVTYLSTFEIEVPSYLEKTGVEYINIEIQVPNTPMEGSDLNARLRIDWNDVIETSEQNIVANTEISSGAVKVVELLEQGIKVSGNTNALSEVTKLNVVKITSGEQYDFAVQALDGQTNIDLYELSFTIGSESASLTGAVDISFPYTSLDGIYRINNSGSKTILYGTQNDTDYYITTRTVGLFAVVNGDLYEESITQSTFDDISSHWAKENIESAVAMGLFNGTSQTAFSPDAAMTNEMAITVLYRIAGQPEVSTNETLWYSKALEWGMENDIIGGYNDFVIGENVTREALATMIYKYEFSKGEQLTGADLSSYIDVEQVSEWAFDGLAWANANGIVNGKLNNNLAPQDNATRAEVATMFCRYVGV